MAPRISVAQFSISRIKEANLEKARQAIETAAKEGATYLLLPEMFICPYEGDQFEAFAEMETDSPTVDALASWAAEYRINLIGGSIPEFCPDTNKIFNTAFVWDATGRKLGKYRKIHLFDVNLPTVAVTESDYLGYGESWQVFQTPDLTFGVAICYDIRFPELIRSMVLAGATCLFLPGAFSKTTGDAHWHVTMRARAIDNQIYVCAAGPAPSEGISYPYYGHSLIVDPFGEVIADAQTEETVIYGWYEPERLEDVRARLPLLKHRQPQVYKLV
jgi:omega-amidase